MKKERKIGQKGEMREEVEKETQINKLLFFHFDWRAFVIRYPLHSVFQALFEHLT